MMGKVALSTVYACLCGAWLCMIIGVAVSIPWFWARAAIWCVVPMPIVALVVGLYSEWAADFRTLKANREETQS